MKRAKKDEKPSAAAAAVCMRAASALEDSAAPTKAEVYRHPNKRNKKAENILLTHTVRHIC